MGELLGGKLGGPGWVASQDNHGRGLAIAGNEHRSLAGVARGRFKRHRDHCRKTVQADGRQQSPHSLHRKDRTIRAIRIDDRSHDRSLVLRSAFCIANNVEQTTAVSVIPKIVLIVLSFPTVTVFLPAAFSQVPATGLRGGPSGPGPVLPRPRDWPHCRWDPGDLPRRTPMRLPPRPEKPPFAPVIRPPARRCRTPFGRRSRW